MENLSPEETNKLQMEKLFNTSECVIKTWVGKFLDKDPTELFDAIPPTEPVYFHPSENSGGRYVKMQLEIVPSHYRTGIDEKLIGEKIIKDTIHFFVYSMKVVYSSVMKTSKKSDAHNACLEWNPETMTFTPEYFPDVKKKRDYLNYVFRHMMAAKTDLPDEKKEEWEKDFAELSKDLADTNEQMEKDKVQEKIESKRLEWSGLERVGIVISYLTEEDLPENVKKGILHMHDDKYVDPPEETDENSKIDKLIKDVKSMLDDKKFEENLDGESPMPKDEYEHIEEEISEEKSEESGDECADSDSDSDLSSDTEVSVKPDLSASLAVLD